MWSYWNLPPSNFGVAVDYFFTAGGWGESTRDILYNLTPQVVRTNFQDMFLIIPLYLRLRTPHLMLSSRLELKQMFHKIKLNVRVNPLKTITNAQLTFQIEYMFLEKPRQFSRKWPTWHIIALFYNMFITVVYVFRTTSCSSSGGQIVLIQHLVWSLSISGRPKIRPSSGTLDSVYSLWYNAPTM
jgi:hypothetical protein